MSADFWKKKNVLITGYEGFLGSHLTRALLSCGAKISGLDIKVRRRETILTARDYSRINVVRGSVVNYKLLERIIRRNKINIIFHLAAEAIVGRCQSRPLRGFSTNIRGTWNILEASRHTGCVGAIVMASSDKAYGSHDKLPYTEKAFLNGNHPYDVSKSCADLIAHTYFHTYGLPVAITRCGNIYGPGDFNLSRIVPDAILSALTSKALLIRSNGKFTRDYVFVGDIVNGYIMLAQKLQGLGLGGEAFNFSDENPIAVIDLVKTIYRISGKKENYKILDQAEFEIEHQYLASSKARRVLGWRPQVALEEGLRMTIAWYSAFFRP
jgi:CDP-glucose 4,6-dehydratase